jgi:hypothetical protein
MNNEFSPIDLQAKRKQCHENIIMAVLGSKSPTFQKGVKQVKSQWIPCNWQHRFWPLKYMSWPFGWLCFWEKAAMLMIYRKGEPGPIKGDNERPSMTFDTTELP